MTRMNAIWDRAKTVLTITRHDGREDLFLWEQAARAARTALEISKLEEAVALRPDETAVVAAALFQNSAWVEDIAGSVIAPQEVLAVSPRQDHFERSAACLGQHLGEWLDADSLARAKAAVVSLHHRGNDAPEALIVSDAVQLEEFSVSSLWPTIRRGVLEGQTIQSVIERWRRRSEYHFWTARLEESFHFEAVRSLARQRLERLGRVISELDVEQAGRDLWPES